MRLAILVALAGLAAAGCGDARESDAAPARSGTGMSPEAYDSWRRPEAIVAALELAPGQVVADVGAGDGYLTARLAEAVGARGRVTATDVDPRALSALSALAQRTAARSPGAAPIDVRRVAADDPGLEPDRYDRVLLAQVDHLLADRAGYLRRLRAALAPGGRVAVSNRLQHRDRLLRAAAAAGYTVAGDADLPGQFLVVLAPPPPEDRR